jgi:hypothetical protein
MCILLHYYKIHFDAFIEFQDCLYCEGYAEQIRQENPESFNFEWKQFQEGFS